MLMIFKHHDPVLAFLFWEIKPKFGLVDFEELKQKSQHPWQLGELEEADSCTLELQGDTSFESLCFACFEEGQ